MAALRCCCTCAVGMLLDLARMACHEAPCCGAGCIDGLAAGGWMTAWHVCVGKPTWKGRLGSGGQRSRRAGSWGAASDLARGWAQPHGQKRGAAATQCSLAAALICVPSLHGVCVAQSSAQAPMGCLTALPALAQLPAALCPTLLPAVRLGCMSHCSVSCRATLLPSLTMPCIHSHPWHPQRDQGPRQEGQG